MKDTLRQAQGRLSAPTATLRPLWMTDVKGGEFAFLRTGAHAGGFRRAASLYAAYRAGREGCTVRSDNAASI